MEEEYHLGTDDQELERLGYQHQVWLEATVKLWREAGFSFGQELLDLGCGPGFATLDLARLVGDQGKIHAVDASDRFLAFLGEQARTAGLSQIALHRSDAHHLELADESVDGAFMRWLLCFVEEPGEVLAEVERVLRPGGTVAIMDYFNYLAVSIFPRRESVTRLFDAYHRSALRHQGSYDIGERLPAMLVDRGFRVKTLTPICHAARPGSLIWRWLALFNSSYAPKLVEQDLLHQQDYESFLADWDDLEKNPASFFFPPPVLGLVAIKEG